MTFAIKRIYEPVGPMDGQRVLVDRLWPRGVAKKKALLDRWLKDVAPSPALRVWFGHKPDRFTEFAKRYRLELKTNTSMAELRILGKAKHVTLLYAARDPNVNHALVLLGALQSNGPAGRGLVGNAREVGGKPAERDRLKFVQRPVT
jgi:uncharacterized protein YeaO (DUF488 family)